MTLFSATTMTSYSTQLLDAEFVVESYDDVVPVDDDTNEQEETIETIDEDATMQASNTGATAESDDDETRIDQEANDVCWMVGRGTEYSTKGLQMMQNVSC
jgi:hypothetical protein